MPRRPQPQNYVPPSHLRRLLHRLENQAGEMDDLRTQFVKQLQHGTKTQATETFLLDQRLEHLSSVVRESVVKIGSVDNSEHGSGFAISKEDSFSRPITRAGSSHDGCRIMAFGNANSVSYTHVHDFRDLDLSLLKLHNPRPTEFFLPSEQVKAGESVAIAGYGLQYPHDFPSRLLVTPGVVSVAAISTEEADPRLLCTANINGGMSGGPVINLTTDHFLGVVVSIVRGTSIDQGQTGFIPIAAGSTLWKEIQTRMQQHRDNPPIATTA